MELKVGALGLVAIMLSLVASIANAGEGPAVWYKPNDKGVYYREYSHSFNLIYLNSFNLI